MCACERVRPRTQTRRLASCPRACGARVRSSSPPSRYSRTPCAAQSRSNLRIAPTRQCVDRSLDRSVARTQRARKRCKYQRDQGIERAHGQDRCLGLAFAVARCQPNKLRYRACKHQAPTPPLVPPPTERERERERDGSLQHIRFRGRLVSEPYEPSASGSGSFQCPCVAKPPTANVLADEFDVDVALREYGPLACAPGSSCEWLWPCEP